MYNRKKMFVIVGCMSILTLTTVLAKTSNDVNEKSEKLEKSVRHDNDNDETTDFAKGESQEPTRETGQQVTQAEIPTSLQESTQAPTQAPTQKQTQTPTQAPTQKQTQAPTQAPARTQTPTTVQQSTANNQSNTKPNSEGQLISDAKEQYSAYKSYIDEVIYYVNELRKEKGVSPLVADTNVCYVAEARAIEMARNNLFSHTRPNGQPLTALFSAVGLNSWSTYGENIAAGNMTPQKVVQMWKDSPGHYANIMNASFKNVGAGVYKQSNTTYGMYWALIFYTK